MDPESVADGASSFRRGAERAEGAEGGNHGSLAAVISSRGLCAELGQFSVRARDKVDYFRRSGSGAWARRRRPSVVLWGQAASGWLAQNKNWITPTYTKT